MPTRARKHHLKRAVFISGHLIFVKLGKTLDLLASRVNFCTYGPSIMCYTSSMSVQRFLIKKYASWKMKGLPEGQRDMMIGLLEKDPQLMKRIGGDEEASR